MRLAGKNVSQILLLLAMMLITSSAFAQSQLISGTVVDQKGAVVPNANVKITDEAKKAVVREVTSDENGRFQALNVQPGSYSITVEAPGFKRLRSEVTLEVNTKLDVGDMHLEIGEVSDTVQIVSELPLVQTNTGEKAFSVDAKQIQELPLNGRNWIALMKTVPGVVSASPNDFRMDFNDVSSFHANGLRGSQNNFYLDGSPNLDVGDNQSQYTQPSVFSIGEFRVQQSGYNAEYGRSSGVVVAVQTKSGTSGFHGTAYEYVRNDALDASKHNLQPGQSKDVLRYNLFGGNIGGWIPIPKVSTKDNKRLFFFYNREMTRRAQPTGPTFIDLPGARTLVNGDFSPFLTTTPMECAPTRVVGTVFQPGTITYGTSGACAGKITGGTPFAGNIVPPGIWNANSANLLKIFTQVPGFSSFPGAPNNPGIVRWATSGSDRLTKNQDLLRIDYTISKSTSTFFRWVNDDQTQSEPFALWGWSSFSTGQPPIGAINRPKPGSSWSWNIVKTISPTLVSETILSYNHQSQSLSNSDSSTSRQALGVNFTELFPGTNTNGVIPNFHAYGSNGLPEIRLAWGSPGWHNVGKDYAVTENLSWSKTAHTMKFGFYYNRDDKQQTSNFGAAQGEINFDSNPNNPRDTGSGLANLLLGSIGGGGYSQANASVYPYFRFESLEGYAQDSWKVNKRLTLEFGLRFQHTTPTYTVTRAGTAGGEGTFLLYSLDLTRYSAARAPQINTDPASPIFGQVIGDTLTQYLANGLVCDPCNGVDRGFSPARNFLSPRVAFAYDVFGDGKTAFRGGFGQYIERLRQNNFNFDGGSNFPNGGGASVQNTNINNITPGVAGLPVGPRFPQGYRIFPKDNTMPTIYSWNVGIQRELGHNLGLDVSYIGNKSIHLMVQRQINGLPAGYFLANPTAKASVNDKLDALRPYRGFGSINSIETSGFADYHGMLVRLSRRFAKGLQFNVNYTLSRARDIVDNDSDDVHNPFNARADFAPAGYDATHNISLDYVYELPKYAGENSFARGVLNGWEVSGITHFQSGFPLNIQANGDLFGLDAGITYPDLIGDPFAGQTSTRFLNPAAFRRPLNGEVGNLGRNALRGPGYTNFDVSLSRVIRAGERVNFKISADAFNVFNHPQVFSIDTGFASETPGGRANQSTISNQGNVSSYRDARSLQFGFRLQF
jgi:hypothetical protein